MPASDCPIICPISQVAHAIQALTQQFQSYFDGAENHTIALWFDPDREYEALLPHLTGAALW